MIALLFLSIFELHVIYGPGAISYAPLEQVVTNRGWQGTEAFDVLLATPDCTHLARWAWLITEDGEILDALIVDCAHPDDKAEMIERGLLADCNRQELVHKKAWLILRN